MAAMYFIVYLDMCLCIPADSSLVTGATFVWVLSTSPAPTFLLHFCTAGSCGADDNILLMYRWHIRSLGEICSFFTCIIFMFYLLYFRSTVEIVVLSLRQACYASTLTGFVPSVSLPRHLWRLVAGTCLSEH